MHTVQTESPAPYTVERADIVTQALRYLDSKMREPGEAWTATAMVKDLFRLRLSHLEHEVFEVAYLDSQNCLIDVFEEFRGTVNQTSVYPREIIKRALALNASAVILAHNHPSGDPKPSSADERLTKSLKEVLSLVDVRVLDHIIVGRYCNSFAELGLC